MEKLVNRLVQWSGCMKVRVSSKTAFTDGKGDRFEKHLEDKIHKTLYHFKLSQGLSTVKEKPNFLICSIKES